MKNYNKISSICMAALLAATSFTVGCNKQIDGPEPVNPTNDKIVIAPTIDQTANSAQTMASGLRGTQFNVSDVIGLYVVAWYKTTVPGKLEKNGNYVDNNKTTQTALNTWDSNPVIYFPTVAVDLYAYAPWSATFDLTTKPDSLPFTVTADQSNATAVYNADFMTAITAGKKAADGPVDLAFYHRMSKLDVKFTIPATFKGKAIKGLKSIAFKGFKNEAVIDMITPYLYDIDGVKGTGGTYPKPAIAKVGSTVVDIKPNEVAKGTLGSGETHYEAIIVPQELPAGSGFIEIVLEYTDGALAPEKFYYQVAPATVQKFVAARATEIKISFAPDNVILLGAVSIKGWEVTPAIPGEVVEREVFNDFTLNIGSNVAKISNVVLTISQGTGTPVVVDYTLPATHTANTATATFSFDGLRLSPEYYPFTIKEVSCKDAGGAELTKVTCNKTVTATGAVTLP